MSIEKKIQEKALVAPRVTLEDIRANIKSVHYINAGGAIHDYESNTPVGPLDLLTFCVIVLKNGFTVTGESACVSPDNFNEEVGREVAYDNAINKIWPLMGYALKEKLSQ